MCVLDINILVHFTEVRGVILYLITKHLNPMLGARIVLNTGIKKMGRRLFLSSKTGTQMSESEKHSANYNALLMLLQLQQPQQFRDQDSLKCLGLLGKASQVVTRLLVQKDTFKVCYGKWKERNTGWHVGYPHFMMMCWRPKFDVRDTCSSNRVWFTRKQNKDGFRQPVPRSANLNLKYMFLQNKVLKQNYFIRAERKLGTYFIYMATVVDSILF